MEQILIKHTCGGEIHEKSHVQNVETLSAEKQKPFVERRVPEEPQTV